MSKSTSSTKRGATAKSTKPLAHPSWIDMIKECIVAHPEDSRAGVSRPTIKKFIETKYKLTMDASHTSLLSRAIISGSEKGTFVLPKGPSGKVKLAPKAKAEVTKETNKAEKENKKAAKADGAAPKKAGGTKKTLTTSETQNKRSTTRRVLGGKAVVSKKPIEKERSKANKKASARPVKTPTATATSTKKAAAAKVKPATKKASTKKSDAKKTAVKSAASKPKKPTSKGKPGSKASAAPKKSASSKSVKPASKTEKPVSAAKA